MLRHSAAARLIGAGHPRRRFRKVSGHRSAAFSLPVYGHIFETELDELAQRMDDSETAHRRRRLVNASLLGAPPRRLGLLGRGEIDVAGLKKALHVLVLLGLERLPRLIDPVVVGDGLFEHPELAHVAAIRLAALASLTWKSALTSQRRVVRFFTKSEKGSASIRIEPKYNRPSLSLSIK